MKKSGAAIQPKRLVTPPLVEIISMDDPERREQSGRCRPCAGLCKSPFDQGHADGRKNHRRKNKTALQRNHAADR